MNRIGLYLIKEDEIGIFLYFFLSSARSIINCDPSKILSANSQLKDDIDVALTQLKKDEQKMKKIEQGNKIEPQKTETKKIEKTIETKPKTEEKKKGNTLDAYWSKGAGASDEVSLKFR